MISEDYIQEAAGRIRVAYADGVPCAPVRDLIGETDLEAAYAVQEINTRQWLATERHLVGRKIGLTSKAVQTQLGVDQPDFGMLYADMDVPLGSEIAPDRVMQPKVEAEIAFVLSGELDEEQLTSVDVMGAVDYVVAAIEIVGSRIANWDIRITDTIADNASSGLFAVGHEPKRLGEVDLLGCAMTMDVNGELVSEGHGSACMGSPLSAVLWLAQVMARARRPLRRGDVILSGALGPMAAVAPGDRVEARIEGIGSCQVVFAGT